MKPSTSKLYPPYRLEYLTIYGGGPKAPPMATIHGDGSDGQKVATIHLDGKTGSQAVEFVDHLLDVLNREAVSNIDSSNTLKVALETIHNRLYHEENRLCNLVYLQHVIPFCEKHRVSFYSDSGCSWRFSSCMEHVSEDLSAMLNCLLFDGTFVGSNMEDYLLEDTE